MKKKKFSYLLIVLVLAGILFTSCTNFNGTVTPTLLDNKDTEQTFITDLVVGSEKHEIGNVIINYDEENIYVTYHITEDGWKLLKTNLYIDIEPPSNSSPGQFPFSKEISDSQHLDEYVIPYTDITNFSFGDILYFAAYAEVKENSNLEGVWGEGIEIKPGKNWAMYFTCAIPFDDSYSGLVDIPETTKILNENTIGEISYISDDLSVIEFDQPTPQLNKLNIGDIIFVGVTDYTPYGLLRKVTEISKENGRVIIETEFTSIEEAVEEAHITFEKELLQQDINYEEMTLPKGISVERSRFNLDYEHNFYLDQVLYEGDPSTDIDDVVIDGEINLNYEMIFNLDIDFPHHLSGIEFRNIVESHTDLDVSLGGSLSLSGLIDPNPLQLFMIPFTPIPIAPPIIITPILYIHLGLDGEVDAELVVGVTIEQEGSDRLEAGFEYNEGDWSILKNTPGFNFIPKEPQISLGCSIKPYAGPQLDLILSGVAGAYCSLYGNLELLADIQDNPWWCLYGGFEVIAGAHVKIFSLTLLETEPWVIFDYSNQIKCADGPFANSEPEIISLEPDTGSLYVNESTIVNCIASDPDGDALTYDWTSPNGGKVSGSGSSITWTAPGMAGSYPVNCTVSDGLESVSEQVIISVGDGDVNLPPEITSTPVTSATKDTPYSYDVDATDPDDDTLTYSLTTHPSSMTINPSNGLISWTPDSIGNYDVTVSVSDGDLEDTQSFVVSVVPQSTSDLSIFLQSGGSLNGTSISTSNPVVTVNSGENITGTLKVQAIYTGPLNNVEPFGYTPSWGSHSSSYITVDSSFHGTLSYNISVNLTAPTTAGNYYLIFASRPEMNLGWVMSQTNWTTGSYSWNDGKDIADLTESSLDDSLSTGYLFLDMLEGSTYKSTKYGIAYVKIVVNDIPPDSTNKLFLQSGGTLNGTSINPSNPVLTVNGGGSITGTLKVQAIYTGPSNNVVPFGYTPSWGSHSGSYVTVDGWIPVGSSIYTVPINLIAPNDAGTYYLTFATSCEMNLGWVMSQTNWTTGSYSWNDGKDIADLTESKLQDSISTGYLYLDMLLGSTYSKSSYGIAYVKIIVTS